MPVYVQRATSEVTVVDGDLPMSDGQLQKLVDLVIRRIEQRQQEAEYHRAAVTIRNSAQPQSRAEA